MLAGLGGAAMVWACGGPAAEPVTPADSPAEEPSGAPGDADAVAEGEAAIERGDFEAARRVFGEIVERRPDHPKANHYLAVALEQLGDRAGAEKHYRAALAAAPSLTDAALNLSALLIDGQKYNDAAAVLADTAKRNPKDPALRINLAYARMGMNDVAGAEAAFAAALEIADTPDARLGLAELQIATKRADEALANIDKAMGAAPGNVDVLAMSAELYRKARAPERCITAYDKALAQKAVAQLFANRGVCKQMNKDMAGAKADYEKAVEADPQYAPGHFLLGRFLLSVDKDRKAAIEAFETCAEIAPDSKCAEAAKRAKEGK